jgi:hypothetical protein
MAEIVQQQNPVATAPTPVVATTPDLTPSQQFDSAVDSRDPRKAMEVATANIGTPVAVAAVKAADLMLKGEQAFQSMIGPIEKAGGIQTPEGRVAAAEKAQEYFKQDDPNMRDAFVHFLTGNREMARAMITGGTTKKEIVTDIDGKMIKVTKNQLGDIVDAEDQLGRKLTRQEYDQRYVGRQKWEDTLTFQNQKEQQTANIAALKESQAVNNAYASAAPEFESKYAEIYDDLGYLRSMKKGLGAQEYADVLKFASKSLGTADSISKGTVAFDQFTKNREANIGKELTAKEAASLGLDAKATWKYSKEGVTNDKSGQTISTSELKNKQSSENKNNELTQNFQQARKDLIASKKFQQLEAGDQTRLLRVLENSYQVGQKQVELRGKHGTPTFMVMPSSVEIEDQYGLGQAKAIQGIFNAKALQLYSAYEQKMLAASGGIAPNPKELERGFTNTKEYKTLIREAKLASDKVMEEPAGVGTIDVKAGGKEFKESKEPKAPPAAKPSAGPTGAKAPPAEEKLPKGIPKGSVKTGLVTDKGLPLYKAPNGTLHTED